MSTATFMSNEQVESLEIFISNYRTKLLNKVPNTYSFDLSKEQLEAFFNSSDFRLWCELLHGDKEFETEEGCYTVPHLNPGIRNPKLKDTHIVTYEDFKEFIEKEYGNFERKVTYSFNGKVLDADLDSIKFEESQVNFNFLRSLFPQTHESEIEEIRKKSIKFIKYFSYIFKQYTDSPYILTTQDGKDVEVSKVARTVQQELSYKRWREIVTKFYEDSSMREDFTILELFRNWAYYSKI